MPIHRHPINRDRRRPITAEHVEKFRRICQLTPMYRACARSQFCFSGRQDEFCPMCEERFALLRELRPHFGIGPWNDINTDGLEAPPGLSPKDAARWWAEALSEALEECGAGAA
jgi:hypothetical protein